MFFLNKLPTRKKLSDYKRLAPQINIENANLVFHLMGISSKLVKEIEYYLADYGLSQGRYLVLILLHREDRELRPIDIANMLEVSKPTTTKFIKSLEKDGLIIKSSSEEKRYYLELTVKGVTLIESLLPGYHSLINKFCMNLNKSDVKKLLNYIKKINTTT